MTYIPPLSKKLYIPLQFFFCKHPGLALPLIALQYNEVKLVVKLRNSVNLKVPGKPEPKLKDIKLYGDYVYLDHDERRQMSKDDHQYLIEQVQFNGVRKANEIKHKLHFIHPVKEIVWFYKQNQTSPMNFNLKQRNDFIKSRTKERWFDKGKLILNGVDRFPERDADYFKYVQPYQHHTKIPTKDIFVYSFSLHPEMITPTGTCNFSKIDNAFLYLYYNEEIDDTDLLYIFATNFNILRIQNGVGGLAYSN